MTLVPPVVKICFRCHINLFMERRKLLDSLHSENNDLSNRQQEKPRLISCQNEGRLCKFSRKQLLQRIRSEQTLSGPVSCSTPRKTGRSSAVHAGFLEKFLHHSIVLKKDPVHVENELDEIKASLNIVIFPRSFTYLHDDQLSSPSYFANLFNN